MNPSVLISGAGGNFGPFVLSELVKNSERFSRIAILCREERKEDFSPWLEKGVEVIIGSMTDSASYRGFTVVISLAGNLALRLQPQMIDSAIEAGVKHFYPSEFGNDVDQPELVNARYYVDKVLTRKHLRTKAKDYPDFSYTMVHIGLFAETFALGNEFGVDRAAESFTWFGNPEMEASFSSMADTARYTVESIFLPMGPSQQERKLNVPNGNFKIRDAINTLGEVQGITYQCNYRDPQETLDMEEHYRKLGDIGLELLSSVRWIIGQPQSAVSEPWDIEKFDFKPLGLNAMFLATLRTGAMRSSSLK